MTTSTKVANNNGELIDHEPVILDANLFYGFIMEHSDYFEIDSHSIQWCVEHILERGRAEITRQIKTAVKQRENKVYGDLGRKYNMTIEQAEKFLAQAAAAVKAQAEK
jgi:hypothetical protein